MRLLASEKLRYHDHNPDSVQPPNRLSEIFPNHNQNTIYPVLREWRGALDSVVTRLLQIAPARAGTMILDIPQKKYDRNGHSTSHWESEAIVQAIRISKRVTVSTVRFPTRRPRSRPMDAEWLGNVHRIRQMHGNSRGREDSGIDHTAGWSPGTEPRIRDSTWICFLTSDCPN
jgi:hypothetical protein